MSTTLSKTQLTEIFAAFGKYERAKDERMKKNICRALDEEAEVEHPAAALIKRKIGEARAALWAKRLYADDRRVPLMSADDLTNLVPEIVDEVSKTERLSTRERQKLEQRLGTFMRGQFNAILGILADEQNPYELWHRWIATVLAIADEQGKSPVDIVLSQEGNDEVCRRQYSRLQFMTLVTNYIAKLVSPDAVMQTQVQPEIEALVAEIEDEAERTKVRREMELEASEDFELSEMCAFMDRLLTDWFAEETNRIYGA